MILQEKIFSVNPGAHSMASSALKMVTPLKVKLEGVGYDIIYSPSVPIGRQVAYRSGIGGLTWDASFIFSGTEKVYVLYKL